MMKVLFARMLSLMLLAVYFGDVKPPSLLLGFAGSTGNATGNETWFSNTSLSMARPAATDKFVGKKASNPPVYQC